MRRHTKTDFGHFPDSDRFENIHIDITPPSQDYKYLVTIIDRATSWPEAIPTDNITAEIIANVLVKEWIARFGTPVTITSDQGRQFESHLFKELCKIFGIKHKRNVAYNPKCNSKVE